MYQDGRCPWHALISSSRVDKAWHCVNNACLLRHHAWYYNLCFVIGATWHVVPSAVVPFPPPPPPHRTASSHRHPPRPTPPHLTSIHADSARSPTQRQGAPGVSQHRLSARCHFTRIAHWLQAVYFHLPHRLPFHARPSPGGREGGMGNPRLVGIPIILVAAGVIFLIFS
jgi:hypothetical protein